MFGLRFGPDFVGEFSDAGHGKLHTNEEEVWKWKPCVYVGPTLGVFRVWVHVGDT